MADAVDKDPKPRKPHEKKIRDTIEQGKLPHSRGDRDLRVLPCHPGFRGVLRQGRDRRSRHVPFDLPQKPEAWPMSTATDVISLYRQVMRRSVAPSPACWRS
ncbi:hypothetical protein ACVOMV_25765 [Mesorhizobium atlanticum]